MEQSIRQTAATKAQPSDGRPRRRGRPRKNQEL